MEILCRLKVILAVISCGDDVDREKFRKYGLETVRIFVEKYPWYYMPPSLHVILIHGYRIIKELILPIGMFSEEAMESNNKTVKKFRKDFSRKTSRFELK